MAETPRSFASWLQGGVEFCLGALRWLGHGIHGLLHHLPAALVVASLVTIGHHQFHMLDAIDSYAFLAIGNRSAFAASREQSATTAVVSIGPASHEKYYRGRSPLNRCELLNDLQALYVGPEGRSPKVMVIDLDLSPSTLLSHIPLDKRRVSKEQRNLLSGERKEAVCEEALYRLLESRQCVTKTVLMTPFPSEDSGATAITQQWQKRMEDKGIAFGDPTLSIRYGLISKIACNEKGLAATAFRTLSPNASINNCLAKADAGGQLWISPRQYIALLPSFDVEEILGRHLWLKVNDKDTKEENNDKKIRIGHLSYEKQVVFFGASYGEDDLYLTPLGPLYGLDIHAAAFLSLLEPASDFSHLVAFLLEVAIGLFFGLVIAFCWHWYYSLRFSSSDGKKRSAPLLVVGLGICLCVLVGGVTLLSYYLLGLSDLWLSPIPIALGMLIESFFTGAVHGAVKEGLQLRRELAQELKLAFAGGPDQLQAAIDQEERKYSHPAHHHQGLSFLGLEPLDSFKEKRWPALLQWLGRLIFFLLLGWALLTLFH
ncbi:hypothetical protein D9M69_427920 [compost metagenome]